MRAQGGEAETNPQADSRLSLELDAGLESTTLQSDLGGNQEADTPLTAPAGCPSTTKTISVVEVN